MPNSFAKYKSIKDAPSVFLKRGVPLIFDRLPLCFGGESVCGSEINLGRRLVDIGNHQERLSKFLRIS